MRHHNKNRKFGRVRKVRKAFIRSLAENFIIHGKIKTTEARAKELRKFVEPIITQAKSSTLSSTRLIRSRLGGAVRVHKVIKEIGKKYAERNGGYTRIMKLPPRKSDGSRMAVIEFV